MKLQELFQKRAELVKAARALLDKAEAEKRDITQEEDGKYKALMDDVTKLGASIEKEERLQAIEKELGQSQGTRAGGPQIADGERKNPRATDEYRAAFGKYLRGGRDVLSDNEYRALQADSDTTGGYLVAPQQMVMDLIKAVDNLLFIRRLATVYPVPKAESLGVPVIDADPADADWTAEIATGSEDSTMAFGKRELHPHPLAKRIKVSNKLLRASFMDAEAIVRERLSYKFAVTEEKGFLTGNGSGQPLGVFTASAMGISTGRDVSTGNTTTSVTFDGLIEAKFTLKQQYWARAQWLFHRDAVKQIAKLKDGEGQYIWRESVRVGEPDRLLGLPVNMTEYAPNTFTTGLYVGLLGDFKNYWIADALDMQFQRLIELYAETNQVGFIGRLECDGMPVLEEAFIRVKLA